MPNCIIGIAGGSGSGKTTLAAGLVAELGDRASMLSVDKYFRGRDTVLENDDGRRNYEHQDNIDWSRFLGDLRALRSGRDVTLELQPWSEVGYSESHRRQAVVPARPLVVVEGYLALRPRAARQLYDFAVYLDCRDDLRLARRRWQRGRRYVDEVLLPMHRQHVEPTARHSDLRLDVTSLDEADVLGRVLGVLAKEGLLQPERV